MLQRDFLFSELKRLQGNLSKLSREQGLDYFQLKEEFGALPAGYDSIKRPDYEMPDDIGTLAKYPSWSGFVIAVKENGSIWPERFQPSIERARVAFDAGLTIMCQSKHPDGWVVLYSIPLSQRSTKRRPFFSVDWSAK